MFDHSGAVRASPFNYHVQSAQFCALLAGLATLDIELAGFDMSITIDGKRPFICTSENDRQRPSVEYTIRGVIFHYGHVLGRGTTCFHTNRADDPDTDYVIKDAWIAPSTLPGKEHEGLILQYIKDKGIVKGVAQLQHWEEVKCGKLKCDRDTVLYGRRIFNPTPEQQILDRVHTRIVLRTLGDTLDHFSTKLELIGAFHDAIAGMSYFSLVSQFSINYM
jgi:hypothetical protein